MLDDEYFLNTEFEVDSNSSNDNARNAEVVGNFLCHIYAAGHICTKENIFSEAC